MFYNDTRRQIKVLADKMMKGNRRQAAANAQWHRRGHYSDKPVQAAALGITAGQKCEIYRNQPPDWLC